MPIESLGIQGNLPRILLRGSRASRHVYYRGCGINHYSQCCRGLFPGWTGRRKKSREAITTGNDLPVESIIFGDDIETLTAK